MVCIIMLLMGWWYTAANGLHDTWSGPYRHNQYSFWVGRACCMWRMSFLVPHEDGDAVLTHPSASCSSGTLLSSTGVNHREEGSSASDREHLVIF